MSIDLLNSMLFGLLGNF